MKFFQNSIWFYLCLKFRIHVFRVTIIRDIARNFLLGSWKFLILKIRHQFKILRILNNYFKNKNFKICKKNVSVRKFSTEFDFELADSRPQKPGGLRPWSLQWKCKRQTDKAYFPNLDSQLAVKTAKNENDTCCTFNYICMWYIKFRMH